MTTSQADELSSDENRVERGHSAHGMVFNEGPRQAAYLMEGMGNVDFPVTTSDPLAQKFFNQGVAQLHGFWFYEAERSFRQAAKIDPNCVMAYWGMAMANQMNEKRMNEFVNEAQRRAKTVDLTDKEKVFIGNGGREDAFHRILTKFPEDIEALAFDGIQPFVQKQYEMTKIRAEDSLRADRSLRKVFEHNSLHPAHHYRIHLWDQTQPNRALESAAVCPSTSPGIAHMWHMSGHLYALMHRYQEATWFMEASVRVDHRHILHDRLMPDQMHFYTHNAEWWLRNLSNMGQVREAVLRSKQMIELPRHPEFNNFGASSSSTYGRQRLLETLDRYDLWEEMVNLVNTDYLSVNEVKSVEIPRERYVGIAYARTGQFDQAEESLNKLNAWLAAELMRKSVLPSARQQSLENAVEHLSANLAVAKSRMKSETKTGSISTLTMFGLFWVGVGFAIWRWMKRKWLIIYGMCSCFVVYIAFFAQAVAPRDWAEVGTAHFIDDEIERGNTTSAIEMANKYVDKHPGEAEPLARLVWAQWQSGDKEAAKSSMEDLRKFASLDLDVPLFQRLTPIAKELGYDGDWRIKNQLPETIASAPPLESLGPVQWKPWLAEDWSLTDAEGKTHSLKDFRGKPVVVLFFLGYNCSHCVEQLYSFADQIQEFRDAGLEVIAISSDAPEKLEKVKKNYAGKEFPYDLVSNSELDVFKAYRAYDDFEEQPLHGTFLIDGSGRVRWQDISYKPFVHVPFFIAEANRLLKIDYADEPSASTVAGK